MATTGNLVTERFNGGADGVTISTSNTSIFAVNSGSAAFETGDGPPIEGSASAKFSQESLNNLRWNITNSGSTPLYVTLYYWVSDWPSGSSNHVIAGVNSSGTARAQLRALGAGGFQLRDSTTTIVGQTAGTYASDQWIRLRWKLDWSAGKQQLDVFVGANLHGTTPDESTSIAGANGLLTNATRDRILIGAFGAVSSVTGSFSLIDYFDVSDSAFVDAAITRVTSVAVGSGSGTGTVVARVIVPATAVSSGAGTGAAVALVRHPSAAAGSGGGTGAAAATVRRSATAAGSGSGTGVATATVTAGFSTVSATGSGAGGGTGTAAATVKHVATAAGSGSGSGTASASVVHVVSAQASGSGGGTGSALAKKTVHAAAAGSGGGLGQVAASHTVKAVAFSSGGGTGSVIAVRTVRVTANGTGSGTGTAVATILTLAEVPPDRILTVPAETRVLVVPAEARTLTIPTEHRTLNA